MSRHLISYRSYTLDLGELYARMWQLAGDLGDLGDGTRLFRPRPGGREALKWLIADLSGTPTDPQRTMRANDVLRTKTHARLEELGWAERIDQVSFRLLRAPEAAGSMPAPDASDAPEDREDDGAAVAGVRADGLDEEGLLRLADLSWSWWRPLAAAAEEATTSPGVYLARSGPDLVYVGMAGERRGLGVRGRLRVYARGRGAVSGLGEAALDRALADPAWVGVQLARLQDRGPARAKEWAVAALAHADLEVCWTAAPDAATARAWERRVLLELEDVALWNRARPLRVIY